MPTEPDVNWQNLAADLLVRNAELEVSLEFYRDNWRSDGQGTWKLLNDAGQRARDVLARGRAS